MKFTCDKTTIQKEIAFAQEVIASKNTISILSNVLFILDNGNLIIRATDLKVFFETYISVNSQDSGTFTVYCDKFLSILNSIPEGEIEIEHEANKVTIKPIFKKVKFNLRAILSEKFPELPIIPEVNYFSLPISTVKEMITNTIFAVSDDESRYFMNGVFFERDINNAKMVATDGRRLAFSKFELEEGESKKGIIIPPKILGIILKHAGIENPISLAISEKHISIKFLNYNLVSVLIDGQFPNYQRVIPENQKHSLLINRTELLDALKRISILVEQKSRKTLFFINKNELSISTEEGDIGMAKEEVECVYDGESVVFAFNHKFIEEPLKVITSDTVKIQFSEPNKAITIASEPETQNFHVVMPMQIE